MNLAFADTDDAIWAESKLVPFGPLASNVAREYERRHKSDGRFLANTYLRESHDLLKSAPSIVRNILDLDQLEAKARKVAEECQVHDINLISARLAGRGLPMPTGTETEIINRAGDWQYWRRVLRRLVSRYRDQLMRQLGTVHKRRQIYCSDHAVGWQRQRQEANKRTLAEMIADSDWGDKINLAEIQENSLANPEKRRLELLTRIHGMEEFADGEGHRAVFITLTAPSKYHSHYKSGSRNKKYNGSNPKEAHDYLNTVWKRIRASLHRQEIKPYGIRIAEPHHDGCPHWHLLLFVDLVAAKDVQRTVRRYAFAEDGTEPGAKKHRVKFVWIDPDKGTATGYVIKYVAKSIDGAGVDGDLFGNSADVAASRIVAWARTWGIRQFQQIGGPSVTVWREYRRLREAIEIVPPHHVPWVCASAPDDLKADWCGFMRSMGGATPGRNQPTTLVRGIRQSLITGECSPAVNRYGEALEGSKRPIVGIERAGIVLLTHQKFWSIQRAPRADRAGSREAQNEPRISRGLQAAKKINLRNSDFDLPDGVVVGPWTRVTNCTERSPP